MHYKVCIFFSAIHVCKCVCFCKWVHLHTCTQVYHLYTTTHVYYSERGIFNTQIKFQKAPEMHPADLQQAFQCTSSTACRCGTSRSFSTDVTRNCSSPDFIVISSTQIEKATIHPAALGCHLNSNGEKKKVEWKAKLQKIKSFHRVAAAPFYAGAVAPRPSVSMCVFPGRYLP